MSDTDFPFDPDDPRVTAYALDEVHDAGARAGFEQLLARSPEARALVEEIRSLSAQLVAEYDEERLLAQAEPSNVIPMAAPRWAWVHPLLRMAATLAVLGIAGALLAPYMRGPKAVKLHPEGEMEQSLALADKRPALVPRAVDGLRAPATVVARGGVASQIALPFGATNAPAPSFSLSINGHADQTDAAKPAARPLAATDAKDEYALPAAPRAGQDSVAAALKPSLERAKAAAPATAAGNALGGGAAGALADAPINAKDAFFQNRLTDSGSADASASGRVFAQSNIASLKRRASASKTQILGTSASPDESGFVSPAQAPLSSFEIASNTDQQAKKLPSASETREMARAPVAGKTLGDFPFSEAPPPPGDPRALAIQVESASCPWAPDHRLVRIGLKGRAGANDARQVQVKFDPARVTGYRLVGGAPRVLPLNAWQEASALYEIVPAKPPQVVEKAKELDRLPVERPMAQAETVAQTARLRMLRPPGLLTVAVQQSGAPAEEFSPVEFPAAPGDISSASADFKFAAAIAAYDLGHLDLAIQLAQEGLEQDPGGYRAAFLNALRKQAQGGR